MSEIASSLLRWPGLPQNLPDPARLRVPLEQRGEGLFTLRRHYEAIEGPRHEL